MSIEINRDKCMGCALCLNACPFGAISMEGDIAVITESCTICGGCQQACPVEAITVEREFTSRMDVAEYKDIWVYAEQTRKVAYELLGEAHRLADKLGCKVSAIVMGEGLQEEAQKLISYGADLVYAVEGPELTLYNDEIHAHVLTELIRQYRPEIVLIGATTYGRSLAPRVSARLDTGLTADCTVLDIKEGTGMLLQTRPAFGGNLMATIVCRDRRPQMATVRPGVFKPLLADSERKGKVLYPHISIPEHVRTRVISSTRIFSSETNLAEAEVIVAVGKGIGSQDNLKLAEALAKALGGVVGATRAVVDAGWVEYARQIGQTGKTVSPKLYIACGISGAVQHTAGMGSSELIVAINKDPDAPIFKIAHIGIVGDVRDVLPELVRQLEEVRSVKQ